MTLEKYIEKLKEFAENNPECLNMEVIYAKDDEGNGYRMVYYEPTKGVFTEDQEFIHQKEDYEDYEISEEDINAVCIN